MTHTSKCETAKGDLCRCECKGEKHGIRKKEEVFNNVSSMNLTEWMDPEEKS